MSATLVAKGLRAAHGDRVLFSDLDRVDGPDLPAIEQLESALATYPGTLLLVTHDRRMLEAVTINRRVEVTDGRVTSREV
jgi:predicted ABC-type transport system involved in lysophospholipase L1 biosynthesis ATPase subunit